MKKSKTKNAKARSPKQPKPQVDAQLRSLRKEIDRLDREMVRILAKRFKVVDKIGKLKKKSGMTVVQKERWQELVKDRHSHGIKSGLESKLMTQILTAIQKESIARQRRLHRK